MTKQREGQHAPSPDYGSEPPSIVLLQELSLAELAREPIILYAVEDTVRICPECGDEVGEDEVHCSNCNEEWETAAALEEEFFEVKP